ncbi:winged helix-turn-helix transcriptional regulator [Candidatus Bathyarchaeota archaeon]|nr:winged helix-turn-helix transcriptional regulator [Candidatus Bathyarchaeota archaeon]
MKFKLQILRDDEVIFEMPLSHSDWEREKLKNALEMMETNFLRYSKIFNALSNKTRLMMMKQLLERKNRVITFTDFMRKLELNPKLVWENTRKLRDGGLIVKIGRGRYRCSKFGETSFMMMSLVLRQLLESQEEFESF